MHCCTTKRTTNSSTLTPVFIFTIVISWTNVTLEICVWSAHSAEEWKAANEELQKSCRYVIKNQTTGERLKIRVVAVNAGGRSPPVTLPEPVLVKEVAGKKCGESNNFPCWLWIITRRTSQQIRGHTFIPMSSYLTDSWLENHITNWPKLFNLWIKYMKSFWSNEKRLPKRVGAKCPPISKWYDLWHLKCGQLLSKIKEHIKWENKKHNYRC